MGKLKMPIGKIERSAILATASINQCKYPNNAG